MRPGGFAWSRAGGIQCGHQPAGSQVNIRSKYGIDPRMVEDHHTNRRAAMDNKHPKSEMPALKQAASAAKDKQGLEKSIAKEKKHHEEKAKEATTGNGPASK
jgi:hypothetical protein